MKFKIYGLLVVIALTLAACSQSGTKPSAAQPADVPPAPYPDTPSPEVINAPRIESATLISLDMLNELDGWAVTEAEIARTNDGGINWYNVTPPEVAETGYSVDMFLLDNDHVWVLVPDFGNFPKSGVVYRTSDGGMTWTKADVPFSRADIQFLDERNGWSLADLGVGAGSNAVAIYQTTDGGATWEQTYTNDPNDANASDTLPLGGLKTDIVPLTMDTAWVTGLIYAPGYTYLYRTDDGGHTWQQVAITPPAGTENSEIGIDGDQMKFVSAKDAYLVFHLSGDSTQTAVYLTQDAGNTWIHTSMILEGAGSSAFLSAREVVIYNGEQFYVTRDAARTWVTVSPDIAFGESFAYMEFVNTSSGWVITLDPTTNQRSLYRTMDGGATWLPVLP